MWIAGDSNLFLNCHYTLEAHLSGVSFSNICKLCIHLHDSLVQYTPRRYSIPMMYEVWIKIEGNESCKSLLLPAFEPQVSCLQDRHTSHYTTAAYTTGNFTQFSGTQYSPSYWPHRLPLADPQHPPAGLLPVPLCPHQLTQTTELKKLVKVCCYPNLKHLLQLEPLHMMQYNDFRAHHNWLSYGISSLLLRKSYCHTNIIFTVAWRCWMADILDILNLRWYRKTIQNPKKDVCLSVPHIRDIVWCMQEKEEATGPGLERIQDSLS